MSGQKLRAILWLRWRLTRNGWAKTGLVGAVLAVLVGVGGAGLAIVGFVSGLLGGYFGLHGGSPAAVMWTWLGLTTVFLFSWTVAVLVDLQRSELIDLPRLMYLPIGLGWAFVVNYVASLIGATIALFAPAMLGLCFGLVIDRGPAMLLLAPLSMGLLFMVTAWTYVFQGWIATWVQNPRRRRALVSAMVLCLVVLGQLPNLVVSALVRSAPRENAVQSLDVRTFACGSETCRSDQACADACCGQASRFRYRYAPGLDFMPRDDDPCTPCTITTGPAAATCAVQQPSCVDAQATIESTRQSQARQQTSRRLSDTLVQVEKIVPPLWLAAGAGGLARGEPLGALLGTFGFAALGVLALLRGYRSTLRFYAGGDGSPPTALRPSRKLDDSGHGKRRLVERRIPGVHDQTAAVAVATLRSMLRAPEIMMSVGVSLVMLPMLLVTFGVTLRGRVEIDSHVRPLVVAGAMSLVNLGLSQLLNNQFGHDRDALRALLLAPVARHRILLGKNMAVLIMGAPACSIVLAATAVWLRLPPLAGVAAVLQMATILLLAGMAGNLLSVLFPYRVEPGSMKATRLPPGAWLAVLGSLFAPPLLSAPAFAGPLAVILGHYAHWRHPLVVDCWISLAMAAGAVGAYTASLGPLGQLLQRRETVILGRVTAPYE